MCIIVLRTLMNREGFRVSLARCSSVNQFVSDLAVIIATMKDVEFNLDVTEGLHCIGCI